MPEGHAVLLWFDSGDFDAVVDRVRAMPAAMLEGPKVNPNAQYREIWPRDPDGYGVVVAGQYGDV